MIKPDSASFRDLRDFLDTIPIIDSHEHYVLGPRRPKDRDPVADAIASYYISDLLSVDPAAAREVPGILGDASQGIGRRRAALDRVLSAAGHTAYAHAVRRGLSLCWGIGDLSAESLERYGGLLADAPDTLFEDTMARFRIRAMVVNIYLDQVFRDVVEGRNRSYPAMCRMAFPLPSFHNIHNPDSLGFLADAMPERTLDAFLGAFRGFFDAARRAGIVCLKDQSAYFRSLAYRAWNRESADAAFAAAMTGPIPWEQATILSDFLFYEFLGMARDAGLPVQLHTGHLAGIRNEISKANAVHLIPTLEAFPDTGFALMHGNWPYMDEYLFLGKNHPNAFLDLCWVQGIDPIYSIELMKRAVVAVPRNKVFAFGGDTDFVEQTVGFLELAKDNVAFALSDLVDSRWLSPSEARQVACDWFHNNPNEFFRLGYDRVDA